MISFNNKILQFNNKLLSSSSQPGPIPLPPRTFRFRANKTVTLDDFYTTDHISTLNAVDDTNHIYDVTLSDDDASNLFRDERWSYGGWLLEILDANTSTITNMALMFRHCISLTTVPLFDTSSVETMGSMFYHCPSLTTVPLFNTRSVTSTAMMFYSCSSLASVPLFNTRSVIDMGEMFDGCTSLTTIPLFDTSSVTTMLFMFAGCYSITSVPLFNTSSVENMHGVFYECNSLTSIPLFDTSSVRDIGNMFYACRSVKNGALALYQQAVNQTQITNHSLTFYDCGINTATGAAELVQIPDDWK